MAGAATSTVKSAYLSKEQFYKECHISKSTALRLIKSGLVPAIDTKRKTNRYLIARADVEQFKRDRERNPFKYEPEGRKERRCVSSYGGFREYLPSAAMRMQEIAKIEWAHLPDVLSVKDVTNLLGYRKETVYGWFKTCGLKGFKISGKHYIPQQHLLEFIVSPEFHKICPKSTKHIDLLRRSYYA